MTPSFTRAEYWLLEAAVELGLPIAGLSNGEAAGEVNKSDHQATHLEMLNALDRLFTEGLIVGEHSADFSGRNRRKTKLKRVEIDTELRRPTVSEESVYYWLTGRGGAAWEAFACPDWELFMDGFSSYVEGEDESRYGEATCPSKRKLEQYIAGAHWLGYEIDQNAIVWNTIGPWKATYWKELPMAHRVHFPILKKSDWDYNMPSWYLDLERWYRWRS